MGYFANLYLVEISRLDKITEVRTSIYDGEMKGGRAYFSWGEGKRPKDQLYSFAEDTIYCDQQLNLLRGYPLVEEYDSSSPFLLNASFVPKDPNSPVVFHLVLNRYYVPQRDEEPFEQPSMPSIGKQGDRLVITYAAKGGGDLRFNIVPIGKDSSLDNYDLTKLVRPDKRKDSKHTVGVNLGVLKFERQVG